MARKKVSLKDFLSVPNMEPVQITKSFAVYWDKCGVVLNITHSITGKNHCAVFMHHNEFEDLLDGLKIFAEKAM